MATKIDDPSVSIQAFPFGLKSHHVCIRNPAILAVNLLEKIFSQSALRDSPPVLVDVGASGGSHAIWQKISSYSIGMGFEPDRREITELAPAQQNFRRWIFSDRVVVADDSCQEARIYLTRFPYCSSTLKPNSPALAEWSFADYFDVLDSRTCPAATLAAVLREHKLGQLDWLKCDTQGTDLRIFKSLPPAQRSRVLAVEFEPGIIDAYEAEDKFSTLLKAMEGEPYWLAQLEINGVPWGSKSLLERRLGGRWAKLYRQLGPVGPGWVNAVYLRRFALTDDLGQREYLLGWVFGFLLRQPAYALEVAELGKQKFNDPIFEQLAETAVSQMKSYIFAGWRKWPGMAWHKIKTGWKASGA